jgi:hypothetical protein
MKEKCCVARKGNSGVWMEMNSNVGGRKWMTNFRGQRRENILRNGTLEKVGRTCASRRRKSPIMYPGMREL